MKRSDVYKMYEDYCEDNGRKPHGKSKFWEYMADKGFMIKRYSDGTYYFKDTAIRESDFITIDDTIANPFEQLDLSTLQNDRNDKNDKIMLNIHRYENW